MLAPPKPEDWDAVRVPRVLGLTTLSILGSRSGAVVEDPAESALYWLIPAGTATSWAIDGTRIDTGHLSIPPLRRMQGPGPHWRMCPGDDQWLTDPGALAAALEDALDPQAPPPYDTCDWHAGPSGTARLVADVERSSGPGGRRYACAPCREQHGLTALAERQASS
ncbi:hypothetical protein [Streptomyces liangshanensis]|uniref:hypothetical protein n=1 Tax=Streptomyces liangshanensis TaxID=2717324 RepID=UPI0036DC55B8